MSQAELPLETGPGSGPEVDLYCDGASRGNPGPASTGAVLKDKSGQVLAEVSRCLGRATNNRAEYQALIDGLQEARKLGASKVNIFADSQLMIRQVLGQYKIKNQDLKELAKEVHGLLSGFTKWRAEHIPRELNSEADALANRALDAPGTANR